MAEKCPKCGAEPHHCDTRNWWTWTCGTVEHAFFNNRKLTQSSTCRIRELEARVAALTAGIQRIRGRFGPGVDAEIDNLLKVAT